MLLGARRELASDVFSLSAILVWLITGAAPFGSTVFEELASVQKRAEPRVALPPELGEVVRRALGHADPDRPSIGELVAALAAGIH